MRARFECERHEAELTRLVYACAVALGRLPAEVWDETDMDDIAPTLEAYVWLRDGDRREGGEGTTNTKTEPLHELDLALIKRERERLARLKAEGKEP